MFSSQKVGKRKLSSLCLSLDNQKVLKLMFEDKKRQVSGKQYSIFLTVLKLKYPFTVAFVLPIHGSS